uniref:Uncharacterized protein n=1 Tax=Heterorhabditis bacteriophora TaxID=37862 RepID=A0A1I7WU39_HETBA
MALDIRINGEVINVSPNVRLVRHTICMARKSHLLVMVPECFLSPGCCGGRVTITHSVRGLKIFIVNRYFISNSLFYLINTREKTFLIFLRRFKLKQTWNPQTSIIVPAVYKVTGVNKYPKQDISFEDFSRISAHCFIGLISIIHVDITLDFFDQVLDLFRKNEITCEVLLTVSCNFNDDDNLSAIDRLLGSTQASSFFMRRDRNDEYRFKKKLFLLPSVTKLKHLILKGFFDFSDDDLSAIHYRLLYLERCCLSEDALRRLLEDIVDGRRNIFIYEFNLQNNIDVERLLKDLPKTERTAEGDPESSRISDNKDSVDCPSIGKPGQLTIESEQKCENHNVTQL